MSAEKPNSTFVASNEKATNEKAANASEPAAHVDVPEHKTPFARFMAEWLIFPKLLYFGLNVVIYSTHAFLPQFARRVWKLQKHEFGLTNFVQFTNLFGSYVFSRLADRTGAYRSIVAGCVAAYCLSMCMLMFPLFDYDANKYLTMAQYLTINGVAFFFTAGTFPLLDSMVMSQLSSNPKFSKEMFGRQRLWGTVGHCIIGSFVHFLEKRAFIKNAFGERVDLMMFIVLIVSSVLFVALVYVAIPKDLKVEAHSHHGPAKEEKSPAAAGPKPSARALLYKPAFAFFLLTVLVAGLVRSVITTYQSPFITDELHYNKSLVSDSIFVRVFPEVSLYFFSKEISQYFGIYWVLLIGHIAGVLRMFGYSLIQGNQVPVTTVSLDVALKDSQNYYVVKDGDNKPTGVIYQLLTPAWLITYVIYGLECLKGVNSSLVISSSARIASDMAPKGLASTAQGYVSGIWQGMSMTIASLMCLFTVNYFAIRGTFMYVSIAGAVCVTLIALKFALIDRTIFARNTKTVA